MTLNVKPRTAFFATLSLCLTLLVLFPPRSRFTAYSGHRGVTPLAREYDGQWPFWRPVETWSAGDAAVVVATDPAHVAAGAVVCYFVALIAYAAAARHATPTR